METTARRVLEINVSVARGACRDESLAVWVQSQRTLTANVRRMMEVTLAEVERPVNGCSLGLLAVLFWL